MFIPLLSSGCYFKEMLFFQEEFTLFTLELSIGIEYSWPKLLASSPSLVGFFHLILFVQ